MWNDRDVRVAAFLSQYFRTKEGLPLPSEPEILKSAIATLISGNDMTSEQIKREALEYFDVIIPYDWFPGEGEQ